MNIKLESLLYTLSQYYKQEVISADYQTMPLHGGTLGHVNKVTGTAQLVNGERLPYRIVLKMQKKWERYDDPLSWRREYDLYKSGLGETFTAGLRWPTCYYAEMSTQVDEWQLWLEYIDGVTGLDLTGDMYEQAALELGRFQGKLYAEQPSVLKSLTNLSHANLMKNTYKHYRSWPLVYDYIRSANCAFPPHISQMLIDIDTHAEDIFTRIEKLPLVLCHRDFWVTNIIYNEEKILLIDWDTAGWGYLGEDIASLIADEADIEHMVEYYQRCVPAYYKGFSEYVNVAHITDPCVYELILLVFGYRLVEWYLHAEDEAEKENHMKTLEHIYKLKSIPALS